MMLKKLKYLYFILKSKRKVFVFVSLCYKICVTEGINNIMTFSLSISGSLTMRSHRRSVKNVYRHCSTNVMLQPPYKYVLLFSYESKTGNQTFSEK